MNNRGNPKRILLLTTPHTYRSGSFRDAAERLGIEVVEAVDLPQAIARENEVELGVDFAEVDTAAAALIEFAVAHPVDAIMAIDDSGAVLAARVGQALRLPHNDPAAAEAGRNKWKMRELLQRGQVRSPGFQKFSLGHDPAEVGNHVAFPAVLKPVDLSGSRGVTRVDSPAELKAAWRRLRAMLVGRYGGSDETAVLVEQYIPGVEVALEGILDDGRLHTLAIFDKPDPLDGPYFEETIYVTPSRLPSEVQADIKETAARAAAALGLQTGPIHAELRVNDAGAWIVEVAGRSIGGLCSQTLRFGVDGSLEELIMRQAVGLPFDGRPPAGQASGVMMIPIPQAGILRSVSGVGPAERVPLIESVDITAKLNYPLVPLPEGESYLGFIFARGNDPAEVEAALREGHQMLEFEIDELLRIIN